MTGTSESRISSSSRYDSAAPSRTILIPILGDHYGRVLDAGDIRVELEDDQVVVRYFEHALPTAPGS
ncbi:MAG: hypothetical protein KY432_08600, partial [Acidobacteria bacterium]|nr:hypothetical protein [Acidobacteriota bacterium]